jgi:hypothetical protein
MEVSECKTVESMEKGSGWKGSPYHSLEQRRGSMDWDLGGHGGASERDELTGQTDCRQVKSQVDKKIIMDNTYFRVR